MNTEKDFKLFARDFNLSSTKIDGYNNYAMRNSIIEPYILEERQLNCAPMSVFSRLLYDRIIFLGTGIDSDVANIVSSQLMYLNSIGSDDISLYLNTPGGSVLDGLAIYDVMNLIKPDVKTYCFGMCASMGSILLSSGTKGKRYCLPNGEVMIHQVSSGSQGDCSTLKIAIDHANKLQNKLYNILSENTGKSFEEIEKDADRDHWFMAEEAKAYGLVDEIIKKK